MTHEELLAEVNKNANWDDGNNSNALRAIVELHKPKEEDGKLWCSHEVCYNHIEFLERTDCDCNYPCPTIQVIEKELS